MNLQHLGCWNHLEKLAEMFLNTFHRGHNLLKLKIKKLLRKIKSKNLTARVFFFFFFFFFLVVSTMRKLKITITYPYKF